MANGSYSYKIENSNSTTIITVRNDELVTFGDTSKLRGSEFLKWLRLRKLNIILYEEERKN